MDLCPDLNISIPVGKDSMSMQTQWNDGTEKNVKSPLSVVISAFSECYDVTKTLTPQITQSSNTSLILIDLGNGKNRMGGSSLNLINKSVGRNSPDLDQPEQLKIFFDIIQELIRNNKLLAYHDRSDGGLITCLLEMSFAGHSGMDININIDEPLPKPSSVINSANHIESIEPVVRAKTISKANLILQSNTTGFTKKIVIPRLKRSAQIKAI